MNNEQKIEGKHDIQQILQTLKKRVQTFESDKDKRKQFKDMINGTELYINELFQKIKSQNGKRKKIIWIFQDIRWMSIMYRIFI